MSNYNARKYLTNTCTCARLSNYTHAYIDSTDIHTQYTIDTYTHTHTLICEKKLDTFWFVPLQKTGQSNTACKESVCEYKIKKNKVLKKKLQQLRNSTSLLLIPIVEPFVLYTKKSKRKAYAPSNVSIVHVSQSYEQHRVKKIHSVYYIDCFIKI